MGSRLFGGAERELTRIGSALASRGHEIRVFCNPEQAEPLRAAGLDARVHHLGGDIAVHDALAFARGLRAWRPDTLLIGTYRKLWLAVLAARLARVPHVVARVGLETDVPRSAKYRLALRMIDHIVVNARGMAAPFLTLPGWSGDRITTIHNMPSPVAVATGPAAIERAAGAPVVGTVARLARQKRLERVIEAVKPLADVHCVIAGDGEERDALVAAAAEIAGRVHFLGYREDVGAVLKALDLFVICSDREGMSSAMIEALAAGVPVVSTPVSGAREALEPLPGQVAPGVITADFSVEALREEIRRLLDDAPLRARMSAAALHVVAERFSPERAVQAWEHVLVPPR